MAEIRPYRLLQLCESIKKALELASGGRQYWIIAEVASLSIRKGHRYIELVDTEDERPIARMQANLWFGEYQRLQDQLKLDPDSILESGKKVLLFCSISFHELYGLKLTVHDINPEYTLGDLEQKKRETIQKLEQQNLIQKNGFLKLPAIIKKIGIISSASASGLEDFVRHLAENSFGYGFIWKLFDTPVQGANAEMPIAGAIQEAQSYDIDALVIIRGGGSRLDLEVFNGLQIAMSIANCRLPVYTGLGHETDETVADLVAHTRCKTPTAVAHAIIEHNAEFHARFQWNMEQILKQSLLLIKQEKESIKLHTEVLRRMSGNNLAEWKRLLQEMKSGVNQFAVQILHHHGRIQERFRFAFIRASSEVLVEQKIQIRKSSEQLRRSSLVLIRKWESDQQIYYKNLRSFSLRNIQNTKQIHDDIDRRVSMLHPSNILRKGFAIVMKDTQVITKMHQLNEGDVINTHFLNFSLSSTVNDIEKASNYGEETK